MTATVMGVKKNPSKFGGCFYYMFFKCDDDVNRRTCLAPNMGNFKRWEGFIKKAEEGIKFQLEGLKVKGKMIDADSQPKEISQ